MDKCKVERRRVEERRVIGGWLTALIISWVHTRQHNTVEE